MKYKIRRGKKEDIPSVHHLVRELAIYERAEKEFVITQEQLLEDGFGEKPVYELFVADSEEGVVGMALYFYHYSTWKGKFLYLEDLVVAEAHRGNGLGKKLLNTLVQEAKANGANRVGWQVLDWNQPAIKFYESLGTAFDGEWINCKVWVDDYLERIK